MRPSVQALELWGGPECTVRRVGDEYLDETLLTGHEHRLDDLELIAALGIRTLRYPVLWERIARQGAGDDRWAWADARLHKLRQLGIRPIAGLVHHGSGPPSTSLTDPRFADGLAEHARAVAARYPWILDYTPVNEPLTTARFSCLYGHWYPHQRDARAFVVAVMTQVRATVLAMAAIRRVQPKARLIQTEDLGFTHSTPLLGYQAHMENERRW
ncbi:MAG: dTDP-4-dehydrorhamnose reductase, partial [Gaiellales bacterium]|nr:dTDP-4-dehydrorhamnose reductase [Gaiellales bacterium]